jgi:asparagine synthase (glutamine-hydrolysing)
LLGFAAVYLIWGSTYFAIRVGVESVPPLLLAGMRHLGQTDVQAFSIGYEAESGVEDETEAAARTAQFLRCRFVSEKLTAESLAAKLDGYFKHLDQPTGDALNTYLV